MWPFLNWEMLLKANSNVNRKNINGDFFFVSAYSPVRPRRTLRTWLHTLHRKPNLGTRTSGSSALWRPAWCAVESTRTSSARGPSAALRSETNSQNCCFAFISQQRHIRDYRYKSLLIHNRYLVEEYFFRKPSHKHLDIGASFLW